MTPLSRADLEDLATARINIEPLVLRLSIAHRSLTWESSVVAAHHLLAGTFREAVETPTGASSTSIAGPLPMLPSMKPCFRLVPAVVCLPLRTHCPRRPPSTGAGQIHSRSRETSWRNIGG